MKVAIISSGCRPVLDGVTVSLHHRLEQVSSLGHEALVFCPDYEDLSHKYPDYKSWTGNILPGVEVMSLPSEPIPGIEFERNYNWQARYGIDAALENFQPDIIHVDEPERIAIGMWGVPGVSFAERHSKPIVAMYRTNFIDMLDDLHQPLIVQWLGQTIIQRVYWSYDATLVSNRITEEKINRMGIENTISGRSVGIDLDNLNAVHEEENNFAVDVPDDKVVLSFVGRLTSDKGWPFILDTFKQVAQEKADWLGHIFVVVAGDGELYDEIKSTLESMHVPVAMLGRVAPEKLPHVYEKTDVCVTASEKETQGNALLECLAKQNPIVAPNVGGHLSFSQNGENSILFPPGDSASFAQSIASLVYDAELRETLGKQGHKDAQEYGMDTVVSNLVDTWEDLIQNHPVENSLAISTQHSFLIQKRNHAKSGFWGRPDATHEFCEPHYATTVFAAEAWNALSSVVFLFGALLAYRHSKSKFRCGSERIKLSCWLLAAVGLGSTLFHLTMRRSMQLLDEVPMILYVSSLLASKLNKIPSTKENQAMWRNFIGTCVVSLIYLYQAFGFYQVFFIGFIILWFCDAFATAQVWHHGDHKHGVKSFITIVIASIGWLIEDGLCETYPSVWILHVAWHFLTCYSSYHIILFNASVGRKKAKEDTGLFHGPLNAKMVDPFHGARLLRARSKHALVP